MTQIVDIVYDLLFPSITRWPVIAHLLYFG